MPRRRVRLRSCGRTVVTTKSRRFHTHRFDVIVAVFHLAHDITVLVCNHAFNLTPTLRRRKPCDDLLNETGVELSPFLLLFVQLSQCVMHRVLVAAEEEREESNVANKDWLKNENGKHGESDRGEHEAPVGGLGVLL